MAPAPLTFPSDRKALVLYDGDCPLCRRSVETLRRLDWMDRLGYADARDPGAWPETDIPLDRERMLEEMHLLTPDRRRIHVGFDAFRWVAARLPLLWAVWPLLYLPGVPRLGRRAYRWVARNRFHLVPCHGGACALPLPAKETPASLTRSAG